MKKWLLSGCVAGVIGAVVAAVYQWTVVAIDNGVRWGNVPPALDQPVVTWQRARR